MALIESFDALLNTDGKTIAATTLALPKPAQRPSDFCYYSYSPDGKPQLTAEEAPIPTNDKYA